MRNAIYFKLAMFFMKRAKLWSLCKAWPDGEDAPIRVLIFAQDEFFLTQFLMEHKELWQ